jgi:hypothetical protein
MNVQEFSRLIERFLQQPVIAVQGRHMYLWHSEYDLLRRMIPTDKRAILDLHQTVTEFTAAPRDREQAARLLRRQIEAWLAREQAAQGQRALLVRGCDLLNHYGVSLSPFFAIASERCMVIFVINPTETTFRPPSMLPDYVTLDPTSPYMYLKASLGEAAVIA